MNSPWNRLSRPTLSPEQVAELARLVADGIRKIGDHRVRAPLASEYFAVTHCAPQNCFDLSVDIEIGETVITVRKESSWQYAPWNDNDLAELAAGICRNIAWAVADESWFEALKEERGLLERRIKRCKFDLEISSVRCCPFELAASGPPGHSHNWTRFRLLDNFLIPREHIQFNCAPRRLKELDDANRLRKGTREALRQSGALLEIEAAAEHALKVAGITLGDCLREMVNDRPSVWSRGSEKLLVSCGGHHRSCVVARHGRLIVETSLQDFEWTRDGKITIVGKLPEIVLASLPGRKLSTLVEHPLVHGDTIIEEADTRGDFEILVTPRESARPIYEDELPSDVRDALKYVSEAGQQAPIEACSW